MAIIKTFFVPHPPLIIPEIGHGEEKKIQRTIDAYHSIAAEIGEYKPDTIIISSPHSTVYSDYFHISPGVEAYGDFSGFRFSDFIFRVNYDKDLVDKISKFSKKHKVNAGTFGERERTLDHATLIPLYFINQYYQDYKIIRISPSNLPLIDHYNLGKMINSLIPENKKVVWVASGDLSHKLKANGPYGIAEEGIEFDKIITKLIQLGDFKEILKLKPKFYRKAAECGLGSLTMMAGALDGYNIISNLLSYEAPFGVGYAVARFERKDFNKSREFSKEYSILEKIYKEKAREEEDAYVRLARMSLEYYINNSKLITRPKKLDDDLINNKAGVFVTLHMDGNLRGCIGTINPTTASIADEIIQNAVSSGTKDYRFSTVTKEELPRLEYSVDVLFKPEPIESKHQLDINKYGVIVRSGYKSGLLLPHIDGINSVDEQIDIARRKARIRDDEPYTLERFEVVRHF